MIKPPVPHLIEGKEWDYLGCAHIYERQEDGCQLLFYDDGDIDCTDPDSVTDEEFKALDELNEHN